MSRKNAAEHEWLMLAVRRRRSAAQHARVETLLHTDLDWDYLVRQARRHGVAPLAYAHCLQHPCAAAPALATPRRIFQESYHQTFLQNTLLYRHFEQLRRAFASQAIAPIALKGIVLANTVYPQIALRPMRDIDLLLDQQDITAAARILKELGYSNILRHLTYVSRWHASYEQRRMAALEPLGHHLPVFIKRVGTFAICVELHHRIAPDMSSETVSSVLIADSEAPIRTLRPDYFLLHLCVHLRLHSRDAKLPRLIWLYDIAEWLNHYAQQIDWDTFWAIGRQHQLEDHIRQSLADAREVFGRAKTQAGDKTPSAPLLQLSPELHARLFPDHWPSEELQFWRTAFQAGAWQGLRYIWEAVFPSPRFLVARYHLRHPAWIVLYYPLRALKAGYRLGKLLKHTLK